MCARPVNADKLLVKFNKNQLTAINQYYIHHCGIGTFYHCLDNKSIFTHIIHGIIDLGGNCAPAAYAIQNQSQPKTISQNKNEWQTKQYNPCISYNYVDSFWTYSSVLNVDSLERMGTFRIRRKQKGAPEWWPILATFPYVFAVSVVYNSNMLISNLCISVHFTFSTLDLMSLNYSYVRYSFNWKI